MYRIALINMPFGGLHLPSLALTQLQAVIDRDFKQEAKADVYYLNHDFRDFFSLDMYRILSESVVTTVTGFTDWMFRTVAFPELEDNAAEYLGRYRNSLPLSKDQLAEVLHKRTYLNELFDELIDRYRLQEYSLVGFTSMFDQSVASFAMARKLKERNPDIITVIGGASCELSIGKVIAKEIRAMDFVFSGPGLKSFSQFVRFILQNESDKCHDIAGVFSKRNAEQMAGLKHKQIGEETDINARLPLDYDGFLESLEQKCPELEPELFFETSRGCWWGEKAHCTFCGLNGVTMNYRMMSSENAIEQFKELFERYPDVPVFFAVDNILSQEYFETVLPYIKVPENANVFYETKLIANEQQMQILRDAGIKKIQPGIEALSTPVLKIMKKGTTAFQNINFLKASVRYNVLPEWNLLIGFPNETEEVYKSYVEYLPSLVHLPPPGGSYAVRFDRFSPYHNRPQDYNLILKPLDFYGLIYPFSEQDLNDYAYFFADHNYENKYILYLSRWRRKIEALVEYWGNRWNQQDHKLKPVLKFLGDSGVIYDSRDGEARQYDLPPLAVEILKCLNQPKGISTLKHQLKIDEEDLRAHIDILKSHKLLFQEGESMLSLVC